MSPLDLELPYGNCKKRSAIRTFSLKPSGIFTNYARHYLIPDITEGETDRSMGECAEESFTRIFQNVFCFLIDYPVAFQVIDVGKHSAGAPCRLCPPQYHYKDGVPDYSNASDVSSRHVSFTRSLVCLLSLRSHALCAQDALFLRRRRGNIPSSH